MISEKEFKVVEWVAITDVDAWIINSIETYPGIFENRFDVLHHIFCVIGNGYEWGEDGKIYHMEDSRRHKPIYKMSFEEFIEHWKKVLPTMFENDRLLNEEFLNHWKETWEKEVRISREAKGRSTLFENVRSEQNVYPLSKKYSMILNVPDNFDPIWEQDIFEMKKYLKENGFMGKIGY